MFAAFLGIAAVAVKATTIAISPIAAFEVARKTSEVITRKILK
jgi:hypothetical protein